MAGSWSWPPPRASTRPRRPPRTRGSSADALPLRARLLRQRPGPRGPGPRHRDRDHLGRGGRVHRHPRPVVRRPFAGRHRHHRRLRRVPDRRQPVLGLPGLRRGRRRVHGDDRHPAPPRPGRGHRRGARRRPGPGRAVPVPGHPVQHHHRRVVQHLVRLDLRPHPVHRAGPDRLRAARAGHGDSAGPGAAAHRAEPGHRRGPRRAGPRGRRGLPDGPGRIGGAVGRDHRRGAEHRAAHRAGRHRAAAGQEPAEGRAHRGRARRGGHLGRHRAGLRQLLLAAGRARLAGELLRGHPHRGRLPGHLLPPRPPPGRARTEHRRGAGMFTGVMANTWLAATAVAVIAGVTGFFAVLRGSTFAAHAIPNGAFAGAAGASLLGLNPFVGLAAFSAAGALGIAGLSRRSRPDVATALTFVMMLGIGALFVSWSNQYAQEAYSLLFGEVFGVSTAEVLPILGFGVASLIAIAVMFRPLMLSSALPEVAAARGLRTGRLDLAFLLVMALATSMTVPVVGALLMFSLMIGPAAAARSLTARPVLAMTWSVAIALVTVWTGIAASYQSNWPLGFFVGVIGAGFYLAGRGYAAIRRHVAWNREPVEGFDEPVSAAARG